MIHPTLGHIFYSVIVSLIILYIINIPCVEALNIEYQYRYDALKQEETILKEKLEKWHNEFPDSYKKQSSYWELSKRINEKRIEKNKALDEWINAPTKCSIMEVGWFQPVKKIIKKIFYFQLGIAVIFAIISLSYKIREWVLFDKLTTLSHYESYIMENRENYLQRNDTKKYWLECLRYVKNQKYIVKNKILMLPKI